MKKKMDPKRQGVILGMCFAGGWIGSQLIRDGWRDRTTDLETLAVGVLFGIIIGLVTYIIGMKRLESDQPAENQPEKNQN